MPLRDKLFYEVSVVERKGEKKSVLVRKYSWGENPVSEAYPVIDSDLGRDNVENDLSAADLEE